MSNDDEIAAAEKRGYSKGYQAGKRKLAGEVAIAREKAAEKAFYERVFLAALPSCILITGWETESGQKIESKADRTRLAWSFAEEAVRQRRLIR